MTNLLFSQASALGKRLAMVLTMLVMLGVTQVWGETISDNITFRKMLLKQLQESYL